MMFHVTTIIENARRRLRGRERGVAVVEYALFVGLIVLGTTAAIGGLEDDAEDYYVGVSDDIGDLPQLAIPNLTLPDGTPITTTTNAPVTTTSTTTSSTTTTSTTTTTAPTTTTSTTTTTTTTAPARTYISQMLDLSRQTDDDEWDVRVRVTLKNTNTGNPVLGAEVKVRLSWYDDDGDYKKKDRKCVTGNNGYCTVSNDYEDDDFRHWDRNVTATVIEVDDESPPWDNATASVVVPRPF